ncbi:oxidoreductase [Candidatus Bipolaricaulota bacterium]|nr:oxidoreductase [Candidatus Bipolaricaulota bacterium]
MSPRSQENSPRTSDLSPVTHHPSLKLAVYWTGSCGGCDVSFLELGAALLDVLSKVEIVFWPALVDAKRADVEALPAGAIDVALINGTLRTEENREMAELLREKSKLIVAYGACAHLGGIPGLANLSQREEILAAVFGDGFRPTPPPGGSPEDAPPELLAAALPLSAAVRVDYVVPGCPPPPGLISRTFDALLGELPPTGHVFASEKALCEECPRTKEDRRLTKVVRPHELLPDPEKCLLDQGMICLGPVTRGGCDAACPKAGMPCTGCLGPTPNAGDQGLAMLSALASLVRAGEEGEAAFASEDKVLDAIVDPVGTFHKYALPATWKVPSSLRGGGSGRGGRP